MKLITERLVLRPFTPADVSAVHAYASNVDNVRYMLWGPNAEKDTEAFIGECLSKADETPRLHYDFAVTLKDTDKLIGGCGIYLSKELAEGMLGWILHMDYWKSGYMPEAAMALLRFGFEELRLHRIYATCNADNYGSWRVMEKCGMRREAHFIKNRFGRVGTENKWYSEYHYAMLDEEWKERRGAAGTEPEIRQIEYASDAYQAELRLRDRLLRKPLGLNLFSEDLSGEAADIHLGAFIGERLVGVLVLTHTDAQRVRMRQVAVEGSRQRGGIGSRMVTVAEQLAREKGYEWMVLHARGVAVGFYEKLGYIAEGEPFVEVGIPHCAMIKRVGSR